MFQIQDTVFYPSGGVCIIDDIRVVPFEGLPDRNYYILHPVDHPQETIFVPVDSDRVRLRHLIGREEAVHLMEHVHDIDVIEEENIKLRRDLITESMNKHECEEWFRVIRTIYRRAQQGGKTRRVSDTERAYADTAKRYLYAELSAVLNIPVGQVEDRISQYAEA